MQQINDLLEPLRSARWFDDRRARAYLLILSVISGLCVIGYLALSRNGLDPIGRPLGTDFISLWTASKLALSGHPELAWSPHAHQHAQAAATGLPHDYTPFFYPPPYLMLVLPLAAMPYLVALTAWLVATGGLWACMARSWLKNSGLEGQNWLLIFGFPAVLVNAGHGQNGFLTAALLGGAALTARSRPWVSGLLIGCLVIKPQLAVLAPIFLIFTGNWKSFLSAAITSVALCVLSFAVLGHDSWTSFVAMSAFARRSLEEDLIGYEKLQSVYAAVRLLGGSHLLSWSIQGVAAAAAIAALWKARTSASAPAVGAVCVCATPLATPYMIDYDLTLMAAPLAWLYGRAMRDGFQPWEKLLLVVGFVLPIVARPLATLGLPVTPLVILALLACILRRIAAEAHPVTTPRQALDQLAPA